MRDEGIYTGKEDGQIAALCDIYVADQLFYTKVDRITGAPSKVREKQEEGWNKNS